MWAHSKALPGLPLLAQTQTVRLAVAPSLITLAQTQTVRLADHIHAAARLVIQITIG